MSDISPCRMVSTQRSCQSLRLPRNGLRKRNEMTRGVVDDIGDELVTFAPRMELIRYYIITKCHTLWGMDKTFDA
jgi:hypothetical protein